MNDCLVLLTKTFPFDKGEEFIENEVPVLAKSFARVILIATSVGNTPVQTRKTPENVSVHTIPTAAIKRGLPAAAARQLPFLSYDGYCDSKEKDAIKGSFKKRMFLTYFIAKSELVFREARRILQNCALGQYDSVTFYSYWFYDIALAAVKLRDWCENSVKRAVSRAHGYDLYRYRNSMGYLPLRGYLLKNLDQVYPCSENGSNYLRDGYPEYRDKIQTSYLGTHDFGLSPTKHDSTFHIISCCYISPVKRVEVLAQALALLKDSGLRLEWTHFGGGEGLEALKEYAQQSLSFMEYRFAGGIRNPDLMAYYQSHHADVFVNTSSSEGLPVSIMEACSFGIPIIATDVGGTGEIVRSGETGFLVDADISPDELAKTIQAAAVLPSEKMNALRQNCRKLWLEQFHAENNYSRFAESIKASK